MESTQRGSLARTHGERSLLPRGRTRLPAPQVRQAQRERLLRAMVSATAEKGYAAVTIADVVERARVSRKAFYEHFADKETCFLAANEEGSAMMFARITAASRGAGRAAAPAERLRLALRAYLGFLADEPEFARTFLIDAFVAGPRAMAQFIAAQEQFTSFSRAWYHRARRHNVAWPAVPGEVHRAVVGAMHQLVVGYVRAGRTAALPRLEDVAFKLHIALYTGWPVR